MNPNPTLATMLKSTALRRRLAGTALRPATRGGGGRETNHLRGFAGNSSYSSSSALFSVVPYAQVRDDDNNESSRYMIDSISILGSKSKSASMSLRGTLLGLDSMHIGNTLGSEQQVRLMSTTGPSRSSTSAAHPSFSSSSEPNDGHQVNHEDGEGRGRYASAKEQGRRYAKRGRSAAKRGGVAARQGAIGVRDMVQKYGVTFLGTYLSIYFTTLGALFAGIDSGLLDPAAVMSAVKEIPGIHFGGDDAEGTKTTVEVVVHFLEKYEFTKPFADYVSNNPHVANLGIAWIAVKFTEPIRLGLSVAIVPRVHRALGREVPVEGDDDHHPDYEDHDDDNTIHKEEEMGKFHEGADTKTRK